MKTNKLINLDEDIVAWLRTKDNASGFVNNILKDYMIKEDINSMTLEQIEIELKIKDIEEEAKAKIEVLRNGKG